MSKSLKVLTHPFVGSLFFASLLIATPNQAAFTDINSHWAKECISQMAPRKLVSGYPDGTFRPNATIT
ncbi:MAG: S-layer homology domain-containing protein, partial [Cyanobacteriota bacterium]|nr:S-layer homology domain-containing protein [Cyanobacteriota bacterium]